MQQPKGVAARAAHWSARHRKIAIFGWLAFVIVAFMLGGAIGTKTIADEDMGNGASKVADQAIAAADFPDKAGEQVLVQGKGSVKIGDPAFTAAVKDVSARLQAAPNVKKVESPLAPGNEGQLSKDGRSALVTFEIPGDQDLAKQRVDASLAATAAAQKANPQLRIEQFGDASADKALSKSFESDFKKAETLSLPITLLILVAAFGALVAAGVPLLLGLTAVLGTLGLVGPISQIFPMDQSASSVILLIGLAVGVDYSMFYLRRKMEETDAGRSEEAALEFAAATSGRAVLISGLTVMIAMAGMFLAGSIVFESFAVGTILVVAVAVLGSLTFLPAMLSWLGKKGWTEKGRVPYLGRLRHRTHGESRVWGWILDRVLRRPVISLVAAAGVLVVLAIPAINMHTINPGVAGLPRSLPIMQTYDRIQSAFPGGPLPAVVAVAAKDVTAPEVQQGIKAMTDKALATKQMSQPVTTTVSPDKSVEVVSIPMQGNGTDKASEAALASLRDSVIPSTIGKVSGVEANVSGMTAGSKDFNDSLKSHMPIVFAFVLGLAFLLLLVTFRSIVVPLKAIALNLLSVGASYGILTWVFQDGHLEGALGFQSIGGITSWLPLFLFVILFGLSMDYHVFIISRVREAVDRGMRTEDAVSHGIKATAGVVTSAAVVMVAVFSIFGTLSAIEFKQMGVGLAVAVLLDATLVRAVLLPSAMSLLGERNWYLPSWLSWLPKFEHEPVVLEEPLVEDEHEEHVLVPA
jgi:RND superfamily putative drug exporter